MPRYVLLIIGLLYLGVADLWAQRREPPINIFGYMQASFQDWEEGDVISSFAVQQLNLFFQRDFAQKWTAQVNIELLNNFSTSRRWGALNLEGAWVRYKASDQLKVKVGLHIPPFNKLNEIKNQSPLLPYIIRPLVYESSFNEIILIEEFVPQQAFAQVFGFVPFGLANFNYALYVGNSSNVRSQYDSSPDGSSAISGVDTTTTFLFGGRLGVRLDDVLGFSEIELGFSATHDRINRFKFLAPILGGEPTRYAEVPRIRMGADLSLYLGRFSFEGEFIRVRYDEDVPEITVDKEFYYGTLGYEVLSERLLVFASYWFMGEDLFCEVINPVEPDLNCAIYPSTKPEDITSNVRAEIFVPNFGFAYTLNERVTLKAHYAPTKIRREAPELTGPGITQEVKFDYYALAISVLF